MDDDFIQKLEEVWNKIVDLCRPFGRGLRSLQKSYTHNFQRKNERIVTETYLRLSSALDSPLEGIVQD